MLSRALGGAREGSITACKSSRTLLCECGGWEAASSLHCSALSLYNAGLSAHIAHSVRGKEILFDLKFYLETNKNIHMYFKAAKTAFVCLIKESMQGGGGQLSCCLLI